MKFAAALVAAAVLAFPLAAQTVGPLPSRPRPPRSAAPRPAAEPRPPQPEPEPAPEGFSDSDPVIRRALAANSNFTQTLPDFVCTQVTTRLESVNLGRSWKKRDTLQLDVLYVDSREAYSNLRVDGRPSNLTIAEVDGTTSTGEYGTILYNLFNAYTRADYRFVEQSMISGRPAVVYDFSVKQERSHWRLNVNRQSIAPAYQGRLWLEEATGRVYRIEMQALRLPPEFPLVSAEIMVEYGPIAIADQEYLLPVVSASLGCSRQSSTCRKNQLQFTDYRKFSASSSIFQTDSEIDFGSEPAAETPEPDTPR